MHRPANQAAYFSDEVIPIDWCEFVNDFMTPYRSGLKAKATTRAMEDVCKALSALTVVSEHGDYSRAIKTTADLTPTVVGLYVGTVSHLRPNTIYSRLRCVSAICNYAWRSCRVRISPFVLQPIGNWVKRTPAMGKKFHRPSDISRVLGLMRRQATELTGWAGWRAKRVFALTSTLAYTGMRAGEAYHLEVEDLDLAKGVIWIRPKARHRLKTGAAENFVPVPPELAAILQDWLVVRMDVPPGFKHDPQCTWLFPTARRHGPWLSGAPGTKPRDRMVTLGKAAGVDGFNPLSLRHSFATYLVHLGQGEAYIKQVLRHTDTRTQAWYVHADLEALRDGVAKVTF